MEYWSDVFAPLRHSIFGTWWGASPERKPKDRLFARLASEICLSSLQTQGTRFFVRDGNIRNYGQRPFVLSLVEAQRGSSYTDYRAE
jgi:hypothetical protein